MNSTQWLFVAFLLILQTSFAWAQEAVPGEFIVKMRGRPSSQHSTQFLSKVSSKAELRKSFGKLNIHHLRLKPGQSGAQFKDEIAADPDVEFIEPNYIYRKVDGQPADNKIYSVGEARQVAQNVTGLSGGYAQSQANTEVAQAWTAMSSSSSDIPVVAVIDTGLDYTHSIFTDSAAIWTNAAEIAGNGRDDDGNGFIDDRHGWNFVIGNGLPYDDDGHGTHVAGIVLGVSQDLFSDPIGQAKIRLMPLKFLAADGSGTTSNAIAAIYYAVNNGATVINNSWGGPSYSQGLHDALTFAYQHNVVVVNAAGNYGSDNDASPMYPANYAVPSSIAVAATSDVDALAGFSNFGKNTVRLAAPGVAVYSTVPGDSFRYMSGTSMAAPFIAGLAAIALREAPELTGYQIGNLVVNAGNSVSGLQAAIISGNRGNGYQTVVSAKASVGASADQPTYAPRAPASAGSPVTVETSPGGCGSVALLGHQVFRGPGPNADALIFIVIASLLPLLVWQILRMKSLQASNRRQYDRFQMESSIRIKVGERELIGQMNTISLGGLSFKAADAMLEKGGVVTLQIASPDGGEQIQVEGRIVWNEQNQSYGVQFQGAKDKVLESIEGWTSNLSKAAS